MYFYIAVPPHRQYVHECIFAWPFGIPCSSEATCGISSDPFDETAAKIGPGDGHDTVDLPDSCINTKQCMSPAIMFVCCLSALFYFSRSSYLNAVMLIGQTVGPIQHNVNKP
jgi:hypothetical protein